MQVQCVGGGGDDDADADADDAAAAAAADNDDDDDDVHDDYDDHGASHIRHTFEYLQN